MDQARSTISKIFNGEPHSYTRFNLTQNMEGDNSQVEMKLSSDMDEEVGGNGTAEHLNHNSNCKPYVTQRNGRTPRNFCFMAVATLLIFIIGYLIGFLVHRKKEMAPVCADIFVPLSDTVVMERGAAPVMDWDSVKKLYTEKLKMANFDATLNTFATISHRAGSPGDDDLGNKILKKFKEHGMSTWTDEHFVKIQELSGTNKVTFNGKKVDLEGFLSYSISGTRTGAVLYAHYGRESDFSLLRDKSIPMNGRVMLVRAGLISFAEKVANAARVNATAVLIYADQSDYSNLGSSTEFFGHVHLGSGDPYTPGFPSFNHTQFPPIESSGLPKIVAQTITSELATTILRELGGPVMPRQWGSIAKLGGETDVITVEVNNVLTEKKITNVFGVIKGFVDADRYVVIGAQRDAWGPGFAKATVGTSVLLEMARSISEMKNGGFKPRRSIVFASWTAGEYGSVGATEWLEGYLSSLNMKAFSYVDLSGVVTGQNGLKISASPLLHTLILNALKEVNAPVREGTSLFAQYGRNNFDSLLEPMKMESAAYPFLAFSGIPALSFRFTSEHLSYPYFDTKLDTQEKLRSTTANQITLFAETAARFAGHITLRLVHDHLLQLDLQKYTRIIRSNVFKINGKVAEVQRLRPQVLPKALTMQWLMSASGSYSRASANLATDIQNSDLEDVEMCRMINDRIMAVERNLLSPYVSPRESPFRHILMGSGPQTLSALIDHLEAIKSEQPEADAKLFRNQFALATWTIQGCANSIAGDIWALDNEI
ncbi:transferrin receptor protein 1-like [Eucyclogobius newberryi]|uniref:transferrin receptor protein 1-like n=1 Tax=Eucyclogobius newberryi TaxID=166745 RepID=UPI003B5AAD03